MFLAALLTQVFLAFSRRGGGLAGGATARGGLATNSTRRTGGRK